MLTGPGDGQCGFPARVSRTQRSRPAAFSCAACCCSGDCASTAARVVSRSDWIRWHCVLERQCLGGQPPKPPTTNRRLIIAGSVALCFLLLLLIGNCSGPSENSRTSTVTSTVTRTIKPPTVTVTAQPPVATITAPPSTVTETAQAAPPLFESTPVYAPPLVDIPEPSSSVYYSNCSEARAAGAAPLYAGEPGYRPGLDRDSDGTACE